MGLKKEIFNLCSIAVLVVIMSNAWCYAVNDTARISKHGKDKPGSCQSPHADAGG